MQKLIFVYNSNSGFKNSVLDSAHKMMSPETYPCNLCDITYGIFAEDKVWKKFRMSSSVVMEFLHKDKFAKKYMPAGDEMYTFPIVLEVSNNVMEICVHTDVLQNIKTVEGLIGIIKKKKAESYH